MVGDESSSPRSIPEAPVVVVTGDPGSGKTTLLTHWFDELIGQGQRAVWFGEEADGTDQLLPGLDQLISEAAEPLTIFLDEVGELRSPQTRRQLVQLIERGNGGHRFVVAQQQTVRLPVARLRTAQLVVEIDDAALSLDRDDLDRIIDERGLVLSERLRSELLARTEGWAGGIVTVIDDLGSARQESAEDVVTRSLAELSGRMVEMIESALGDGEFDLLVDTSVVERLEPGLCREVVGRDGPLDIERLSNSAPFVAAPGGDVLRLHGLARQGLLSRLVAREGAGEIAGRHRSAADWLEANGRLDCAIDHCLQVAQPERAADILAAKWSADDSAVGHDD
ncbi:MAG: hypothetical protein ACR2QK_22995, partial [Acidimicrobiales bacterium]